MLEIRLQKHLVDVSVLYPLWCIFLYIISKYLQKCSSEKKTQSFISSP